MNDVVKQVLDGDKQAFRKIIREYSPGIRVFLASHIHDHHTVEDLSQEIFVAVYWNLKTFKQDSDLGAWIRAGPYLE